MYVSQLQSSTAALKIFQIISETTTALLTRSDCSKLENLKR